jgi:hypothetical protein
MLGLKECNPVEMYHRTQTVCVNECISKYGPNHVKCHVVQLLTQNSHDYFENMYSHALIATSNHS